MWRKNQKADQFYNKAKLEGYRARSAYKLLEIQNKFNLIRKDSLVIDLGCAPGGWIQVAQQFTNNPVYGIDLLPVDPIPNAVIGQMDFLNRGQVDAFLGDAKFDVILSDLAPQTSGMKSIDHYRSIELVESVILFANQRNAKSSIVMKLFDGEATQGLLHDIRKSMRVSIFKPQSSRADSCEIFLVCKAL